MMGITRAIDKLGRVVLPKEMRNQLGWNTNDSLYVHILDNSIILIKSTSACIFCNTTDELLHVKKYSICGDCKKSIADAEMETTIY